MSKRIPFEEITEDMVLEEYRKQHQHLSHDFQHLEVKGIEDWEEVRVEITHNAYGLVYVEVDETDYEEAGELEANSVRAYKFLIECTIIGRTTRYEYYRPCGLLHFLTECTKEDEEDQGDFLGHYINDGEFDD